MTWNYKKLEQIKGIGTETAEDIINTFDTEEKLVNALKNNKVGLRNDIVEKLNDFYDNEDLNIMVEEVIKKDLSKAKCNSCGLILPVENIYGICPYCGRIN